MNQSPYNHKKVLVTGASGFIGSHLCQSLYDAGAEVHGVSRDKRTTDTAGTHWWQEDLSNKNEIDNLLNDIEPDYIFHLASYVVGARDLENVMPTFLSNLSSTVNLLTSATKLGCTRIVLVGSQEEPQKGNVIPSSPYAAAKWSASAYARMFHALYNTPVTIARVFMVYGPGQNDLNKLIPYVTLALLREQIPKLTGGTRQIDWIYVKDIASGLLSLAASKNVEGRTVDLGSGSLVTIKDTINTLEKIISGKTKPVFGSIPDRPMEQVRVADVKKTYDMIGWKPEIRLQQGLKNTVEWYKCQLNSDAS